MASPEVFDPPRFQCCPPTCGAAAAILCSDDFARRHNIHNSVYIAAQSMATDFASSFEDQSMIKMVGYDMAVSAAKQVYEQASIGPEDVDVVELHDCFTANELLTYEAIGLCVVKAKLRTSSGRATTPTVVVMLLTRRVVCSVKATPSARPGSPNVRSLWQTSWSG